MEQVRVHSSDVEILKSMMSILVTTYKLGACFLISDLEKVIFKVQNKLEGFKIHVGEPLKPGGTAEVAMKNREVFEKITGNNNRDSSMRARYISGPIWTDDESGVIGSWGLIMPRRHNLDTSFNDYAPIIANFSSEGGLLYITDKNVYRHRQGSEKFDIQSIQLLSQVDDICCKAMESGNKVVTEYSETVYGIPTLNYCTPMYDEETHELIGTFGLVLPRQLAQKLKDMANNMGQGLTEVSSAMQEMAAASTEININQGKLHNEIENVKQLTEKINQVMAFIKDIANRTKMLGLNASIEAARAGESGRGFGVVAEEIRKLSDESKRTVEEIKELTGQIQSSTNETLKSSQFVLQSVGESAAATEEVNASLEEMARLSEQLDTLAVEL